MNKRAFEIERHDGLGASDVAAIYGLSPYKTPEELYNEKILPEPPESPTGFAMARGNSLEPILRKRFAAWWNLEHGTDETFDAEMFRLEPPHAFMRASLDGISKDKKVLVEFKYISAKNIASGMVPEHYRIQVQHQLLCSSAERGFICMANQLDGSDMRIVEIPKDNEFLQSHLITCEQFWLNVLARKAPPSTVETIDDERALRLAEDYAALTKLHKEMGEQIEVCREELIKYSSKDESRIGRLHLKKVSTRGSIDYASIDVLKGLDLEQYRKAPRESYRITVGEQDGINGT